MSPNYWQILFDSPWIQAAGWTLIHFVWQGAAIGLLLAIVLQLMRPVSAQARYAVATIGLAAMALIPLVTFGFLLASDSNGSSVPEQVATVSVFPAARSSEQPMPIAQQDSDFQTAPIEKAAAERKAEESIELRSAESAWFAFWRSNTTAAAAKIQPVLPWLVMVWLAVAGLLAIRLCSGLLLVKHWASEGSGIDDARFSAMLERLKVRMGIHRAVSVLVSNRFGVPAVIGWIKPVLLIPPSLLTGLSPAQLESILAHELAHIRRHDYLINLVQSIVEVLLFYHPVVWWLSHQIRREREHCCDDIALCVCGDRAEFARALARLEEIRSAEARLALSAAGPSLSRRIRRILRPHPESGRSWQAGAAAAATQVRWPFHRRRIDGPRRDGHD